MSLTMPFTGRRSRKHSPDSIIRTLRSEIAKFLNWQLAADDYFTRLVLDRDQVHSAWQFAELRRQEAEAIAARALEESAGLVAEVNELRAQLAPYLAAEANANRITVPPSIRPISGPEEQATGPIDVRALWNARDAGLLGPVLNSGHATTP